MVLTGFKTFGDHNFNPTEVVVQSITEDEMKKHHISKKLTLDVTCKDVDCFTEQLCKELDGIDEDKPLLVVHMGVGPNIVYYLEQCAYNNKDFRIPDNSGYQPER